MEVTTGNMATSTYERGDLTVFWDPTRCIHTWRGCLAL